MKINFLHIAYIFIAFQFNLLGQNKIDEKKLDKLFWEGKYPEILQDYYILYKQDLNNPEICFKYGTSLLFEADSIQKLIKANNLLLFSASQETATAEYHFYCGRAYHARSVFDSALVQFELYKSKKVKKTIELPADLFITYCNNGKSLPRISSGKLDRYSDIPPEDIGESYDLRKIKMNGRFDPYKTNLTKVDIKKGIKPVWLYSDYTLKFFASYGEKDEGNKDIYMVEGSRDQKKITRLPNIINTSEDEDYPYFDFETNYLYFSSKGHNSIGGYDIFRIDYDTSTHSFGKVENLGLGISTPFDDYLFIYNSKVNQALLTSSWLGKTNRLALFSGNLSIYDKNKEKKQNIVVNFKNESDPTIKLTEIKVLDKNTQELIGKFTVDEKGNAGINLLPGEYSYIFNIYGSKDDFKANISIPSSDTPILQEITFKLDDKNNEKVIITDQNSGKNNEIIAENLDKDSQKNELISNPKDNQTDIINPINPNLEKEALERLGFVGLNQNEIVDKVSDKLIEFELAQKENELLMSNLNAVIAANRTYYEELQQEIDSIEGSIVEISEMEKIEKLSYIKNLIAEQNEVMNQTLWMQTLNDSLQSVYSEKQKLNDLVKLGDRIQDLTEQNNYADAYRNIIEEYKQIETLSSNSAFENIYNELYENELEQARIEKNIISLTSEIVTLNENLQNTELDLLNASKKDKTRLEEQRTDLQQKINSNKKQTKAYQRDLEETKNQGVDLVLKRNLISTVTKEVVDETLSYENAKEKYFTETNKSQLHLNSIQQRIKESNEKLSDTEKKYLNISEEYMTKKSNLDENGSTEQLIELDEKLTESIKKLLSELNENQQNITSNGVVQENYLQEKLQESQARINELRENQTDIVSTNGSEINNEKVANPDVNSSNNITKNQTTNSQNSQQNQNSTSSSNNNEKEANSDVNSSNNIAKNQPTNSQNAQQNQNSTSSTNINEKQGNPEVNSSNNVANNQTNNSQTTQQNQNSTSFAITNEKEANPDVTSSNNIAKNQPTNSQNSQQNQNTTSSSNNNEKEANLDVNSSNNIANNQPTNSQKSQQNQSSSSSTNTNGKEENPDVNSSNNIAKNQTNNSQNSQQNQNSSSYTNNNEKQANADVNSSKNIAKNQPTNSQNSQQNQNSSSSSNNNEKVTNPDVISSNNAVDKQAEYIPQLQNDISEITNEELTNLSSEFKNAKNSVVSELKNSNPTLQLQSTDQLEFEKSRLENNLSKIETEINDLEVLLKNQKKKKEIEKIEFLTREKKQELKSITEQIDQIVIQIDEQKKEEITLNLNDHSVFIDEKKSKEILSSSTYKEYVTALVSFQKEKENHTSISNTLINQQNKLNELINIQVLSKDNSMGSVEIVKLIKEIEKSQKQQEYSYNQLKERKKSVDNIEQENQNILAELQTLATNRKEPLTKIEVVKDEIISSGGFELNPVSNTKTTDNAIIPMNVKAPSGLIYRVQVGAFRKPLQTNVYSQFTPVSGELQPTGLTVYMAGYFNNSLNAVNAKNQIQSLGYSDAFIVAFCNGKKLTLGEARLLESRGECIPQGDNTFLVEISKNTKQAILEQKTQSNISNSTTSTVDKKSLFFTVQIGVYNKPIDEKQKFPGLTEINLSVSPKNQIRYATGMFSDLNSAKIRKNSAVQSGISDAFIVAYYKGERITIAKANELLAENDELIYKPSNETNLNVSIDSVKYVENENPLFEPEKEGIKIERIKYKVNSIFDELPKDRLAYFNQYGLFQFDNETGTLLSTDFSREIDLKDELKLSGLVSEVKNNDKLDNTKSVQMDDLKGDLMDVILRTNWLNSIETSKEISLILNSRISTKENYTNLLKNTFDLKIENYDKK